MRVARTRKGYRKLIRDNCHLSLMKEGNEERMVSVSMNKSTIIDQFSLEVIDTFEAYFYQSIDYIAQIE